jgi:hypothetical protein
VEGNAALCNIFNVALGNSGYTALNDLMIINNDAEIMWGKW